MARYLPDTTPQDGNRQKEWFKGVKAQLTKENLSRGYYSTTDHMWLGMNDIWWALTHPHKAIPRNIGQLTMIIVVVSIFGTLGYIFFGEPYSAKVDLEEPSSLLKVASDHTVRPFFGFFRNLGGEIQTTVQSGDDDGQFEGQDYRR